MAVSAPRRITGEQSSSSLVLDVIGLYVRRLGNWIMISSLVRLLESIGVTSANTRTAVSRMLQNGVLVREVRGGVSGYGVSERFLRSMDDTDRRVLAYHRSDVDDPWLLLSYSIPETIRAKRDRLRRLLIALGAGTPSRSVWLLPGLHEEELDHVLEARDMLDHVDRFYARSGRGTDMSELVLRSWDLDGLASAFSEFNLVARSVLLHWENHSERAGIEAFVNFTKLIDVWRPLCYLDPGLPVDLLPAEWPGVTAEELFAEIRRQLEAPAHDYVRSTA